METMNADAVRHLLRCLNDAIEALTGLDYPTPSPFQIGAARGNIEVARDCLLRHTIAPVRIEPVAPALDVAA